MGDLGSYLQESPSNTVQSFAKAYPNLIRDSDHATQIYKQLQSTDSAQKLVTDAANKLKGTLTDGAKQTLENSV